MAILVKKIRPQLIPIVESYHVPDEILLSTIGNSYGDIYENKLDVAMNSKFNRDCKDGVPAIFEDYIKPFISENPKYTNELGKL